MIFESESERRAFFVTSCCYRRRRLLDHPKMCEILAHNLAEKLDSFGAVCAGYVFMPDHAHLILWLPDPAELPTFMKSWKQSSSLILKRVLRNLLPNYAAHISKSDPFWHAKYNCLDLFTEKKARGKLEYMHLNPVRTGLVAKAIDWQWSSARYYLLGEANPVPLRWIF